VAHRPRCIRYAVVMMAGCCFAITASLIKMPFAGSPEPPESLQPGVLLHAHVCLVRLYRRFVSGVLPAGARIYFAARAVTRVASS